VIIESSVSVKPLVTPFNSFLPHQLCVGFHCLFPVQLTIGTLACVNGSIQGSSMRNPSFLSFVWTRLGPSVQHSISFGAPCLLHAILLRFRSYHKRPRRAELGQYRPSSRPQSGTTMITRMLQAMPILQLS
jgi:hypothetical protein